MKKREPDSSFFLSTDRTRSSREKFQNRKLNLNRWKCFFFLFGGGQTLDNFAQSGCGASILWDIQNLTGQHPGQPPLVTLLEQGVGPDDLKRSLPTKQFLDCVCCMPKNQWRAKTIQQVFWMTWVWPFWRALSEQRKDTKQVPTVSEAYVLCHSKRAKWPLEIHHFSLQNTGIFAVVQPTGIFSTTPLITVALLYTLECYFYKLR